MKEWGGGGLISWILQCGSEQLHFKYCNDQGLWTEQRFFSSMQQGKLLKSVLQNTYLRGIQFFCQKQVDKIRGILCKLILGHFWLVREFFLIKSSLTESGYFLVHDDLHSIVPVPTRRGQHKKICPTLVTFIDKVINYICIHLLFLSYIPERIGVLHSDVCKVA